MRAVVVAIDGTVMVSRTVVRCAGEDHGRGIITTVGRQGYLHVGTVYRNRCWYCSHPR